MALNLLKAGFEVSVFNRTASKCRRAAEAGARVADSVGELTNICEAVVVMVSDDDAVRMVTTGGEGILTTADANLIVIDSSTIHPHTSREVAAALGDKGIAYLDAPVTGSRPQAEDAQE